MLLKHLSLTNFRNFARLDTDLPQRAVLLAGSNAQGKTSLLESIYFLATFTSFQTHSDRQLVNFFAQRDDLAVGRIIGDYQRNGSSHRLEARLILEPIGTLNGKRLRKEVLLDGVKRSLSDVIGHLNAVLFVPQMSQIIEGGPEERRRYINLTLAQTIPAYARTLSEYSQAITQRNALLKQLNERGGDPEQLAYWDDILTDRGSQLIDWRIRSVQELESLATGIHSHLTRGKEVLRLDYQPAFDPLPRPQGQLGLRIDTPIDRSGLSLTDIRDGFRKALRGLRREEIARGITTIGPHRDELRFVADTHDLGDYGSRGQVRTALLSLKMAEVDWMKARTGQWPIILLDEVMAELDLSRRADLLGYLDRVEQVLLTTTDLNLFTPGFVDQAEVWCVQAGTVTTKE